jgi:pimeloyl-ACP methyl ester carboxylesterase
MSEPERLHGGEGPPLLLLHSGTLTFREWRGPFQSLSRTHEVFAPTLPGSLGGPPLLFTPGQSVLGSMTDQVERWLDEFGWHEPVAVAGSSLGGVIALELAARGRAERVAALAPPWMGRAGTAGYAAAFIAFGLGLRLCDRSLPRWAGSAGFRSYALCGQRHAVVMDADDTVSTLRSFAGFPWVQIFRDTRMSLDGNLPDFSRIKAPVRLIWGTSDRLVPLRIAHRWQRRIPHAELVTLPGFPHVPHFRDPKWVAELIEQAVNPHPTLEGAPA